MRPFSSNAMATGLWTSGSAAASSTRSPASTLRAFRISSGEGWSRRSKLSIMARSYVFGAYEYSQLFYEFASRLELPEEAEGGFDELFAAAGLDAGVGHPDPALREGLAG